MRCQLCLKVLRLTRTPNLTVSQCEYQHGQLDCSRALTCASQKADVLTICVVTHARESIRRGCLWVCGAVAVQKLRSSLHQREVAARHRVKHECNALQHEAGY